MHEHFNAATWLVDRHVEAGDGDRLAVISGDRTWTYAQVADEVAGAAASLRAIGVVPEQRVALALLDSIEFVATFLGAMRIGAVPVAMNPLLPGRDLGVITERCPGCGGRRLGPDGRPGAPICAPAPPRSSTVLTTGSSAPRSTPARCGGPGPRLG